jgi:hypothetical protein
LKKRICFSPNWVKIESVLQVCPRSSVLHPQQTEIYFMMVVIDAYHRPYAEVVEAIKCCEPESQSSVGVLRKRGIKKHQQQDEFEQYVCS